MFTLHQPCCSSAAEQSHLPVGSHIPDCAGHTPKRISGHILVKRDAWGKRGSVQFVEGEVFLKHGNEGQRSQFTSGHGLVSCEQDSLWNSLCKPQPGTGTTPCTDPLSKPEVSFSRFLAVYTISAVWYEKTPAALQESCHAVH